MLRSFLRETSSDECQKTQNKGFHLNCDENQKTSRRGGSPDRSITLLMLMSDDRCCGIEEAAPPPPPQVKTVSLLMMKTDPNHCLEKHEINTMHLGDKGPRSHPSEPNCCLLLCMSNKSKQPRDQQHKMCLRFLPLEMQHRSNHFSRSSAGPSMGKTILSLFFFALSSKHRFFRV